MPTLLMSSGREIEVAEAAETIEARLQECRRDPYGSAFFDATTRVTSKQRVGGPIRVRYSQVEAITP